MGILKSIQVNHFAYREKRGHKLNDGYKTYWFVDLHGTVLKPNYTVGKIPKEFYPHAKESLQLLTKLGDISLIMYTCSHPNEIIEYVNFFSQFGITFNYINENPEVQTDINGYGCYDKKPYINVLFEDKSGFDPETEWKEVLDYMISKYGDIQPKINQ